MLQVSNQIYPPIRNRKDYNGVWPTKHGRGKIVIEFFSRMSLVSKNVHTNECGSLGRHNRREASANKVRHPYTSLLKTESAGIAGLISVSSEMLLDHSLKNII